MTFRTARLFSALALLALSGLPARAAAPISVTGVPSGLEIAEDWSVIAGPRFEPAGTFTAWFRVGGTLFSLGMGAPLAKEWAAQLNDAINRNRPIVVTYDPDGFVQPRLVCQDYDMTGNCAAAIPVSGFFPRRVEARP